MKNQVDAIRGNHEDSSIAHFLNSSLNKSEAEKVVKDVTSGKTKLLYVAPETLTKQSNIDFFKSVKISFVAVDEAHCISEWDMTLDLNTGKFVPSSSKLPMFTSLL